MTQIVGAPVRWGMIGLGSIASVVAAEFPLVEDGELTAVASRSRDRARRFAADHRAVRAYGSYADLIADPAIDAVYVATPHPYHRRDAAAAIGADKAVLVEKAFTATRAGAEALVAAARSRGVVLMEAMWTRYQPVVRRLCDLVADGAIGEVTHVEADLSTARVSNPETAATERRLGRGALLDLGPYVVSFAQMLLGNPVTVRAQGSVDDSGLDVDARLRLEFATGGAADLTCSLLREAPHGARVTGSAGWIDVLPEFQHPSTIVLDRPGRDPVQLTAPPRGTGYAHEFDEVNRCLLAGELESPLMPLSDTLAEQGVLDDALRQLGTGYPELDDD